MQLKNVRISISLKTFQRPRTVYYSAHLLNIRPSLTWSIPIKVTRPWVTKSFNDDHPRPEYNRYRPHNSHKNKTIRAISDDLEGSRTHISQQITI